VTLYQTELRSHPKWTINLEKPSGIASGLFRPGVVLASRAGTARPRKFKRIMGYHPFQ
jgi:hypothetical protein